MNIARYRAPRKLVTAVVYALVAFAFFGYFDGLYGGEPIKYHLRLIHVATAAGFLFEFAAVLSAFPARGALVVAILACVLAWPYFSFIAAWVPWLEIFSTHTILRYSTWADSTASVVTLTVASIYSIYSLRSWVAH